METNSVEVAQIIDKLVQEGKLELAPAVEPKDVKTIEGPKQATIVPPAQPPVQPQGQEGGTTTTPEVPEGGTAPEAQEVVSYLYPILKVGMTLVELRKKLGREKGPAWVVALNSMVQFLVGLRNDKKGGNQYYEEIKKAYGSTLGDLAAGVLNYPKGPDGKVVKVYETLILCSKPGGTGGDLRRDLTKELVRVLEVKLRPTPKVLEVGLLPTHRVLPGDLRQMSSTSTKLINP